MSPTGQILFDPFVRPHDCAQVREASRLRARRNPTPLPRHSRDGLGARFLTWLQASFPLIEPRLRAGVSRPVAVASPGAMAGNPGKQTRPAPRDSRNQVERLPDD